MTIFFKLTHILSLLTGRKKTRLGVPSGVLIVSVGGLGDTILFSLVLPRFMQLAKKNEQISILVRKPSQKIGFLFPVGIDVISIDFKLLKENFRYYQGITKKLFDANFRLVVSTDYLRHPNLDEALIKASAPSEARAMEPRPWTKYNRRLRSNRRIYSKLFDSGPIVQDKINRWTSFANWLLNESEPPPIVRFPAINLRKDCECSKDICLIHPFSAIKEKQSPVSLYVDLIPSLPRGTEIRLTGTPDDLFLNPEYGVLLQHDSISFDNSSFEALAPVIQKARLVISVDTALMHLAAGLGAPTLCLASAAYVDEITPYAPESTPANVRFIYHDMPCRSCLGSCIHPTENKMYPCVARISNQRVQAAVSELLAIKFNKDEGLE